jgi:DNA polymerase-3 subunit gamma/tau
VNPQLLLLGPRYFDQEIIASGEALKRDHRDALRYLFLRAVRKLLRRFDTVLWEGEEKKISKLSRSFDEVEEQLDVLAPGAQLAGVTDVEGAVDRVVQSCAKIAQAVPEQNIPIHMIRKIAYWARTASGGATKVVIVENADRMLDSSRNALLKTLEEPPPSTYFVLLTTSRSAIIPTILSRVRSYPLVARSRETANEVLRRIFREGDPEFDSLRQYFVTSLFTQDLASLARGFLQSVLADESDLSVPHGIAESVSKTSGSRAFRYFAEELFELFHRSLRGAEGDSVTGTDTLQEWTAIVGDHVSRVEVLNMNLHLVLESLYLKMRAAA